MLNNGVQPLLLTQTLTNNQLCQIWTSNKNLNQNVLHKFYFRLAPHIILYQIWRLLGVCTIANDNYQTHCLSQSCFSLTLNQLPSLGQKQTHDSKLSSLQAFMIITCGLKKQKWFNVNKNFWVCSRDEGQLSFLCPAQSDGRTFHSLLRQGDAACLIVRARPNPPCLLDRWADLLIQLIPGGPGWSPAGTNKHLLALVSVGHLQRFASPFHSEPHASAELGPFLTSARHPQCETHALRPKMLFTTHLKSMKQTHPHLQTPLRQNCIEKVKVILSKPSPPGESYFRSGWRCIWKN